MEEMDFPLTVFVLYALVLADVLTTVNALLLGGTEVNPLFYAHGFQNFVFFKVGFAVATVISSVGAYRYLRSKKASYTKAIWGLLLSLIVFYVVIVINNILVIWRLQ